MQKFLFLTALLLAALPSFVHAENIKPAEQPAAEESNLPELPPTAITVEQKIEARKGLQKNIYTTVETSKPRERRQMLDAVATMEKARVRRSNLTKAPEEKIKYKTPNVNDKSDREMRKYLQDVFVAPLDKSLVESNQE